MAALSREHLIDNPFYVLGLRVDCSRAEVEREGQKLLGMLELKLKAAVTYDTPLGPAERTPEKVRQAMAELRDPARRLVHELWARLPVAPQASAAAEPDRPAPWPEARWALGFWERSR